jgi:hypothetical protein
MMTIVVVANEMVEFPGAFHHIGLACDRIESEIESLALIGYANEGP